MKKWAEWLLVAGALCMGMAGCGSEEKNTSNADAEQKSETASETREEGQAPEQTDTEGSEEAELQTTESDHAETGLTFADLAALQFEFCSGAGGWSTDFTIEKDGSFPAYITIQIWGIPGMAIRMEPCITAIFQDISRT